MQKYRIVITDANDKVVQTLGENMTLAYAKKAYVAAVRSLVFAGSIDVYDDKEMVSNIMIVWRDKELFWISILGQDTDYAPLLHTKDKNIAPVYA